MATFFVSPEGDDRGSGSRARPFATLEAAREAVRALRKGGRLRESVTVILRGGLYFLRRPFVLNPADSGAEDCPVTYRAAEGETPILSGGAPVGAWTEGKLGRRPIWSARLPAVRQGRWFFRELFVNGRRRPRARLPKGSFFHVAELPEATADTPWNIGQQRFRCHPGDLAPWSSLPDAEIIALHLWSESHLPIASFDPDSNLVELGKQSVFRLTEDFKGEGCRYWIENVAEALQQPGEWALDSATGTLQYLPERGEDPETAQAIAPRLAQLLRLEGREGRPVSHVHFEGLSFAHTEWSLPPDAAGGAQAAILVPAAIHAAHAQACRFERCEVAHAGTYAFEFGAGCDGNLVSRCHLWDLGAGGVKMNEGSAYTTVADCEIEHCGQVFPSAVGVWIGKSSDNQVVHNHIHHLYYTGVSVGWSWGYAPSSAARNVVDYNHIHHIGQGMLSDMGAVYTLGDSPGTRVCHNLVHDILSSGYGGWGLYTDEGSTGILLANNVVYNTKCGGFHQHYGKENLIQNNVFAFALENQINRTRNEDHVTLTFQRNIVAINSGQLLGGNWEGANFRFDHNLYFDTRGPIRAMGPAKVKEWQARGFDQHSVFANPQFVNPRKGDFSLKPGSPAERIGFQAIDLSSVGPRR